MRQTLVPLVLCILLPNAALAQGAAGGRVPKECELLTPEVVKKINVASNKGTAVAAPKVMELGAQGSACEWGEIMMQVDPFTRAQVEQFPKSDPKSWESVPGVGDGAYFHNVKDMMGELFVVVGKRTLVVMMPIPSGTTVAAFRPNFIDVAKAIVPKLR